MLDLRNRVRSALAVAAVAAVLACAKNGPAQLAVMLVDAPSPVADEIWVNVASVRAHDSTTGWSTVSTAAVQVDLLKLQQYAQPLGLVGLPAGKVTQIRLVLAPTGNHVVVGGVDQPLTVPSGIQSGVKIIGPWTLDACQQTTVTLDFDGNKSVYAHPTGSGTEWILRPVIRTKKVEQTDTTCGDGTGGGNPTPGVAGTPCTSGGECLSGTCDVTCQPGGAESPCVSNADCATGTCGEGGTCGTGAAQPANTPCTADVQCLSSACVDLVCAPGQQGAPCQGDTDCATGLTCQGGFCAEAPPPPVTPLPF